MSTATLVTIECNGFEIQEIFCNDRLLVRGDNAGYPVIAEHLALALNVELERIKVPVKAWHDVSRAVDATMPEPYNAQHAIELTLQALRKASA
jgi:hypothetical protein